MPHTTPPPTPGTRRRFVLLLALTLLPATTTGQPAAHDPAALRTAMTALIREQMATHDTVGLSIALIDDQKLVWADGFGHADRERNLAARADTLYSVGGITQLFTAAATLQLADQGAIRLDEPVRKYLPEFSMRSRFANAAPITARHLLSHHAGLPAMHFRDMWTPRPEPLAAFVARLKDEYVAFPPGQVFVPSFPGYDVLGRMIEVQCGQPYASCVQSKLLAPLAMRGSTFDFTRVAPARRAMHYWKEKPIPSQTVRDLPAAGLTSSVEELGNFVRMLFADGRFDGRAVLSATAVREMLRAQNAAVALDLDNRIAMPWRLSGVHFRQAGTVAWLNNESPFSRGRVLLVPEHKLGVIVLTNSSRSSEAVEKVSERLMELALESRAPRPAAHAHDTALIPTPKRPTRADIEGHYASVVGLISVRANGDHYRASMLGKTLEVLPDANGLLAPEYRFLGVIPIPISVLREVRITPAEIAGRKLAVAYYRDRAYRLGEKITPQPLPAAWRNRLGEYRILERDPLLDLIELRNAHLTYSEGLLYFRYRVPGWLGMVAKIPVRPVSDTELVVEGTGWLMGETVQVVKRDGREVLRYSGYEFGRVARP